MRTLCLYLLVWTLGIGPTMAQENGPTVYLIPGQGSDYRLFNQLKLEGYRTQFVHHTTPDKGMSLPEYARVLSQQIDTTQLFILVGVSLGGMLAVEMNTFLQPQQTVVISSAKSRKELPFRYRFQKALPLYRLVSGKASKKGALLLQPLVEPDREKEAATFEAMLQDKDPDFLKRTIAMIMQWERKTTLDGIVHIHGDNDRTLPSRNVQYDHLVEGGSHMMVLTRGQEISQLVLEYLNKE